MKIDENISNALSIPLEISKTEPLPAKVEEKVPVSNLDQENDYNLSRKTFRDLIETGNKALDNLFDLAKASEHPRSYEVLATLIRTVADTTNQLYDLQKKTKDLKDEPVTKKILPDSGVNIEKAVFVGSTNDLLQRIKDGDAT